MLTRPSGLQLKTRRSTAAGSRSKPSSSWFWPRSSRTATDLRSLVSMLLFVTELERMSDYAAGIARICLDLGPEPRRLQSRELEPLAEPAIGMLGATLIALDQHDAIDAERIALEDELVDGLYRGVTRTLVDAMTADAGLIPEATHVLWAAHDTRTAGRSRQEHVRAYRQPRRCGGRSVAPRPTHRAATVRLSFSRLCSSAFWRSARWPPLGPGYGSPV